MDQLALNDQVFVGDRAWQLHDLQQRGYPILSGFVIPRHVFQAVLADLDLPPIGISGNSADPKRLQSMAQHCRQQILKVSLTDPWVTELWTAVDALAQQAIGRSTLQTASPWGSEHIALDSWDGQWLWLRSSITRPSAALAQAEEDCLLPKVTQYDRRPLSFLRSLKEVWAEVARARNLAYWQLQTDALNEIPLSVVVQALPPIATYATLNLSEGQGLLLLRDLTLDPLLDGVVEEFTIDLATRQLLRCPSVDRETWALTLSQLQSTIDLGLRLQQDVGTHLRVDVLWERGATAQGAAQPDRLWVMDVRPGLNLVSDGIAPDFPFCALSPMAGSREAPTLGQRLDSLVDPQAQSDRSLGAAPVKLAGSTTGQQRCRGPAVVISQDGLPADIPPGRIIVTAKLQPNWVPQLNHAIAFVTEEGSLTSHGAILARELGIPIVVNVPQASQMFRTGDWLCIDNHQVYQVESPEDFEGVDRSLPQTTIADERALHPLRYPVTATQLLVSLSQVDGVEALRSLPIDGIGLVRSELMLASWLRDAALPSLMAPADLSALHQLIVDRLTAFTQAVGDRPLFYRTLDHRSGLHDSIFTAHGTLGYQIFPDWFELELRAIEQVCRQSSGPFRLVLPFVRTVEEFRACYQRIRATDLLQLPHVELWIMAEVPAILFALDALIDAGVQGVMIGTGDLHQLLFAIDRDDAYLNQFYPLHHPAMLKVITDLLQVTNQKQIPAILCLHSPHPDEMLLETAIAHGIQGVSINPDALGTTWRAIARMEKRLLLRPSVAESSWNQ
nr:putative PEP-binding protein [Alkalinema sp. FACHB-956]